MQVHLSGNNVPAVKLPPNHISPPSTAVSYVSGDVISGWVDLHMTVFPP